MHFHGPVVGAGQQREIEMRRRGQVLVYHPQYDDPGAVLLSFPATDGDSQTPGVHRGTIHVACAILANNRFDGYISAFRDPSAAHGDLDQIQILPAGNYYFHVPQPLEATILTPYPVVPNFRAWEYPHNKHIPGWANLRIEDDNIPGSARTALSRDSTCRLTDSKEAMQSAHIVPEAEREWFARNRMWEFCPLDSSIAGSSTIDQSSNNISLRTDIHKLWDMHRLLFVPKPSDDGTKTRLVAHVNATSAELLQLYQNFLLQELRGISKEYLFARFAYGIFRQIRRFLQFRRDRWLIVQESDGTVKEDLYAGPACAQFADDRSSKSATVSSSMTSQPRTAADGCDGDYGDADHERLRNTSKWVAEWVEGCMDNSRNDLGTYFGWSETDVR